MQYISRDCKTFQMRAVLERRGLGDGNVTHAYVTKHKRKPDDEMRRISSVCKTFQMRAVQGVASTPQGAYLAYVTKEHGTTTQKCDVFQTF